MSATPSNSNADANSNAIDATTTAPTASSTLVRIGTRTSALAMWQANHFAALLQERNPTLEIQVVGMNTTGDVDQIKPLRDFGNKGVFTKELDTALLSHKIDTAVHCMKDLPTTLPTGLCIGAALTRGNTQDSVIINSKHLENGITKLADLPPNSVIGTSALRRMAAITKYFPHLKCDEIRGNVNTRLAKLDRGEYDAIILASVGLERLGLDNRISEVLDQNKFGYAVGQGTLAVVIREDDSYSQQLVSVFNDSLSRFQCEAERGLLRTLEGGCKVPIAVHSKLIESESGEQSLSLWAEVTSLDAKLSVGDTLTTPLPKIYAESVQKSRVLGEDLGRKLISEGAEDILAGIR